MYESIAISVKKVKILTISSICLSVYWLFESPMSFLASEILTIMAKSQMSSFLTFLEMFVRHNCIPDIFCRFCTHASVICLGSQLFEYKYVCGWPYPLASSLAVSSLFVISATIRACWSITRSKSFEVRYGAGQFSNHFTCSS